MFPTILFIIFLTIAAVASIKIIAQQTIGVVERFGRFNRLLHPGLNILIPLIERYNVVDLRVQQLDVKVETKTSDNVFVNVIIAVQYCVEDEPGTENVYNAYYKLSDHESQIRAYIFDAVRASVPGMSLDNVFANKDQIAKDVLENLQATMNDFGFHIRQALITDISPDEDVKRSMNRINAAKRDQEAATFEAEAKRIRMIAEARAEAESKKLQGAGTANQRMEIAKGIQESAKFLTDAGINPNEAMTTLLAVQWMDAMVSVAGRSNSNVIMMPNDPINAMSIAKQVLVAGKALDVDSETGAKE